MLGDYDAARFLGHVGPWLKRVRGGLLRDDRLVAELLEFVEVVELLGLAAGLKRLLWRTRWMPRFRHGATYTENAERAPETASASQNAPHSLTNCGLSPDRALGEN